MFQETIDQRFILKLILYSLRQFLLHNISVGQLKKKNKEKQNKRNKTKQRNKNKTK